MLALFCAAGTSFFEDAAAAAPSGKTASAKTADERARAETARKSVDQRISELSASLSRKESLSEEANSALKKADSAISDANRRLRTLSNERRTVERQLSDLKKERSLISSDLSDAEALVDQISRAQYLNHRRRSWQIFLDGAHPERLSLEAAQLRYLALAQSRAVAELEKKNENVLRVSRETQARQNELARIARDEETNRKVLIREKSDRQAAASQLKKEIASQQAQIEKLRRDQSRLSDLVASIDKRLAQERAAEEKARAGRLAAENARRSQNQKSQPAAESSSGSGFARARGRLTRPVPGSVTAQFGSRRTGSATWQGIFIRSREGTDVRACYSGTVVFSDWLRGYGNLVIVDHGGGFLSVYANNETLLKNVGDKVKQGETISTVGSSGTSDEPGLYFEIRNAGKPVNPTPWLASR